MKKVFTNKNFETAFNHCVCFFKIWINSKSIFKNTDKVKLANLCFINNVRIVSVSLDFSVV